jgi:transcriptional/translational regulatory protein YebC/TACO1
MNLERTEQYLLDLVIDAYKIDIFKKCRKTKYILARITYAQLLKNRGHGASSIGRIMNKNHATILNYFKSFEWFYKTNSIFFAYYNAIEDKMREDFLEQKELNEIELKKELILLQKQNNSLYLANKELKKQIEELKDSKVMYLESKM